MESEVSFRCSGEPTTGPFSRPNKCITQISILFSRCPFLIISLHNDQIFHVVFLPLGIPMTFVYTSLLLCMQQEGERCIHSNFGSLKRRALLGMLGLEERKTLK